MKKITLSLVAIASVILASCAHTSSSENDNINPVIKDKSYPAAHYHSKNVVISPFKPYNLIDVKGITPGHLARDMSTADTDSNGNAIVSSAKIFQIPARPKVAAN